MYAALQANKLAVAQVGNARVIVNQFDVPNVVDVVNPEHTADANIRVRTQPARVHPIGADDLVARLATHNAMVIVVMSIMSKPIEVILVLGPGILRTHPEREWRLGPRRGRTKGGGVIDVHSKRRIRRMQGPFGYIGCPESRPHSNKFDDTKPRNGTEPVDQDEP
jgi:hypothetical protein